MTALATTNAIIAARDIAAALANAEGQVLSRTAELAEQYAVIVDSEGSFRAAARTIGEAGLPYASHSDIKRLLLWHELVTNIAREGGGEHTPLPFSRDAVLPILADRYFVDGAGELAALWLSKDWPTIKDYVRAVRDRHPAAVKPKPRSDDPAGDLHAKVLADVKGRRNRRNVLRDLAARILVDLPVDTIAEALADVTDDRDVLATITRRAEEMRGRRQAINTQVIATVTKINAR